MRRSDLGGDVTVNSVPYVLKKDKDGLLWRYDDAVPLQGGNNKPPVSEQWRFGAPGGMGETYRLAQDSVGYAFSTLDASSMGFYRLPPRRITATPASAPVDKPTVGFITSAPGDFVSETGSFVAPAAPGQSIVSHSLGVVPKAIILWTSGDTSDGTVTEQDITWAHGICDMVTSRCTSYFSANTVTPSNANRSYSNNILQLLGSAATVTDSATYTSADATQFIITWGTKSAAQFIVHYMIVGGSDVSAKVIEHTMPTVTGNKAVTGVGFQPEGVFHLFGGVMTTAGIIGAAAHYGWGAMDNGGGQWSTSLYSGNNMNPTLSYRSGRSVACINIIGNQASASAVSCDPDGFTLNYTTAAASAYLVASLCLKGVQVKLGYVLKKTSAGNQAAEPLVFTSTAYMLASVFSTGQSTESAAASFGLGAASATTTGQTAGFYDKGAVSPSDTSVWSDTAAAFIKQNTNSTVIQAEASCGNVDMNQAGWLNWSVADAEASYLYYAAFAPLADSDPYIYQGTGQRIIKSSVTANVITVEDIEDFGSSAAVGSSAAYFNGSWYVPMGAKKYAQKLTPSYGTGDTWADVGTTPVYALAFATLQDGATARLARAHTVNKVQLSPDGADWSASSFDVGSTSSTITALIDGGSTLYICKDDGTLWRFDPTGASIMVYPLSDVSEENVGCGAIAIQGTDAVIWNTIGNLLLYAGDVERPSAIGPDSIPTNQSIAGAAYEPFRGRHYESTMIGDWLWSLYRVTESAVSKTYLLAMKRSAQGFAVHTIDRFDGVVRGLLSMPASDGGRRLHWTFPSAGTIGYQKIGADGSPDAGRNNIGYGAPSTDYYLYYPEIDFGEPHTLKRIAACQAQVSAEGTGASTGDIALSYGWIASGIDQGATAVTWTENDLNRIVSITGSAYKYRFYVKLSTSATWATTDDFHVKGFIVFAYLRPTVENRILFTVTTGEDAADGAQQLLDAKAIRDNLVGLLNSNAVTYTDPDGNTGSLRVTVVSDVAVRYGDTIQYDIGVEAFKIVES